MSPTLAIVARVDNEAVRRIPADTPVATLTTRHLHRIAAEMVREAQQRNAAVNATPTKETRGLKLL